MATFTYPVDLNWSSATGGPGVNVWHLRTTGDSEDTVDIAALSEIVHTFYSDISAAFPTGFTAAYAGVATSIEADPVTNTGADAWVVPGSSGSVDTLPPATQLVVTMRTPSATRSGRGRKFFGPLITGMKEPNGTPAATCLTLFTDAFTDLVSSSEAFTNGAVGVWSPTQSLFRDVTGFSIADRFAVLRSRRD